MKKIAFLLILTLFSSVIALGQTKLYTGVKIGPKSNSSVAEITKILRGSGNKISIISGTDVLSVINPDSLPARGNVVLVSDSNSNNQYNYVTPYYFKHEPTNSTQTKILKQMGIPYKAFPPYPIFFNTSSVLTDNRIYMQLIYIPDTIVLTGVSYYLHTNGSYTADQFNGFALYKATPTTVTQVAITANTATAWSGGGYAKYQLPFTAPYIAAPGLYYEALIANWSAVTTVPTLDSQAISEFVAAYNSIYLAIPYVPTQNSFASSYTTIGNLQSTTGYLYAFLPY